MEINSDVSSYPRIYDLFDAKTVAEYSVSNRQILEENRVECSAPTIKPEKKLKCYLCGQRYDTYHWFYHSICPDCGDVAYEKRNLSRDLTGYRAMVTGGRLKLGYQIALKLLRSGAEVMITSRNWIGAERNYQSEPDYPVWSSRLHVAKVCFDLIEIDRLLPELDAELSRVWPDNRLDIVVHNAAQTISTVTCRDADKNADEDTDRYGRTVDKASMNTWTTPFGSVCPEEAKNVLLANAWAPFVLNQFLLERLRNRFEDSVELVPSHAYIIHVHAKEGHFSSHKSNCHTHTNMAKAALSMLTRCLAVDRKHNVRKVMLDYANEQSDVNPVPWTRRNTFGSSSTTSASSSKIRKQHMIRVHGVDPGWFSIDEYTERVRLEQKIVRSPIDEIDAASRVVYPIMIQAKSFPGTWKHYVPLTRF